MALQIRQINDRFAGEVSGIDITKPLTRGEAEAIEAGMNTYAVLVFHDQKLTDDQQQEWHFVAWPPEDFVEEAHRTRRVGEGREPGAMQGGDQQAGGDAD